MSELFHAEELRGVPVPKTAALLRELAAGDDPQALLAALMAALRAFRPRRVQIIALSQDEHGRLQQGRTLAAWQDGAELPGHAAPDGVAEPIPISELAAGAAWPAGAEARRAEPAFFPDLERQDAADELLRRAARAGGFRAAVLVPLYIESYGGWQGVLCALWEAPHEFSEAEAELYRIVMAPLSMHLGGLVSQERLRSAIAEMEVLQSVSRQLNAATTLDEVLRALAYASPERGDVEIALSSIESDANGNPLWATVLSQLRPADRPGPATVGKRFHLPDLPFTKLYLDSPDAPVLIGDTRTDPRIDELTRSIFLQAGICSTILLALTVQGRWVGLLSLTWHRPLALGPREQRLYAALARHAALRLDNSLMVERLRASLEETRQQGAVLRTVLDNIPVGVLYTDAAGHTLLSNAASARLLGRTPRHETELSQYAQAFRLLRPDTDEEVPSHELAAARALRSGTTELIEVDVLLPSHERNSLEVIAIPMRDGDGPITNLVIVQSDVTARKRAAAERLRLQEDALRLQEDALRAQAAALAERSSPLIPITDEILVLPIIGSIDSDRGQQVLDTVLSGASQTRARVAIIDITGVRTVDTQAASALTNAAQALRLLGVLAILTGIKAEVAQTLVGLGISLDGIVTRSTLRSGIQYALRHLGQQSLA
ncbi:MAG: STAS domain-containing protein [Polyangia bacterium]